jgi:putative ABC transport system permease protein
MTLSSFIVRNAFRNKRRSTLTVLSIAFSLLLLTLMMTIWRTFYIDQGAPDAAKRVITRHKVSLAFFLPGYYRDKIRSIPGVVAVVPMTWFGGKYIDDRPEHSFTQMATDPDEYLKVASDKIVPPDQVARPGSVIAREPWWMSIWRRSTDGRLGTASRCSARFSKSTLN